MGLLRVVSSANVGRGLGRPCVVRELDWPCTVGRGLGWPCTDRGLLQGVSCADVGRTLGCPCADVWLLPSARLGTALRRGMPSAFLLAAFLDDGFFSGITEGGSACFANRLAIGLALLDSGCFAGNGC